MSSTPRIIDVLGNLRPLRRVRLGVLHGLGAVAAAGSVAGFELRLVERFWAAVFAAFVSLVCAHARRWTWVLVAGAAAVCAGGVAQVAGVALLLWALLASFAPRRSRHVGAVLGAACAVVLLHADGVSPGLHLALGTVSVGSAAASAYRIAHRADRVVARRAALGVCTLTLVVCGAYGVAALRAHDDATMGVANLRDGLDAAAAGDTDRATAELRRAAHHLAAAEAALDPFWAKPVRFLPFVRENARAVDQMATSGALLATIASDAAASIDLDHLDMSNGQLDLRLAHEVGDASASVADALDRAVGDLRGARSPWLVAPVEDRLAEALAAIVDAQPAVHNVRDAAAVAPTVLGDGTTKRYLVLFTTPVEARAMIGFPGNFAELEVTDGRLRMTDFGRIGADLQTRGVPRAERTISGPAEFLARYGRYEPASTWPSITMSPDFPTVAQVAAELYPQSGGRPVDGVLTVDPSGLAALLALTGPVSVPGVTSPISAANAVEFLQLRQYLEYGQPERIDTLEAVARATFERLTNGTLPGVRTIADVLAPAVERHHLRFVAFDTEVAEVLGRAGADGAFPPVAGDSLAVLTTNAASNKLDAFMRRSTTYDVVWDPQTGAVEGRLTVAFTNTTPTSGLPYYVLGNPLHARNGSGAPLPAGTNRTLVSIYTPWRPSGAQVDGAPVDLQIERELDRFVGTTVIDLLPGSTVTVTATWQGKLAPGELYLLDVVHQPEVAPNALRVNLRTRARTDLAPIAGTDVPAPGLQRVAAGEVGLDIATDDDVRLVVRSRS